MIDTLALFLSHEERCQSRYVTDGKAMEYEADLFIQGILKKEDGSYELASKGVLTSRFPTTVIDLEKEEIFQSCLFGEHCYTRHQFLNLDLECLWNDDEDAPLYPALGLFHNVKHESKMINDMLSDIQLLPPQDSIRVEFIENFTRLLRRKALALIKYIEDLSKFGCDRMESSGLQEARQQLHLTKDGDFLIILAFAEKLRPNIYMCAMGESGQNGTEAIYRNVLGCL